MKQVVRHQCDFCKRVFAKPETTEQHEKECCQNPDGVNCFICENREDRVWDDDYGHSHTDTPCCKINEEALHVLKHGDSRAHKSYAPHCSSFKRVVVELVSDASESKKVTP